MLVSKVITYSSMYLLKTRALLNVDRREHQTFLYQALYWLGLLKELLLKTGHLKSKRVSVTFQVAHADWMN